MKEKKKNPRQRRRFNFNVFNGALCLFGVAIAAAALAGAAQGQIQQRRAGDGVKSWKRQLVGDGIPAHAIM